MRIQSCCVVINFLASAFPKIFHKQAERDELQLKNGPAQLWAFSDLNQVSTS